MLVLDETETVLLLCHSFWLCGMMYTANYLFEEKMINPYLPFYV